ncbi:hypothetical protein V2J09_009711 [Rumex salicifolius]
MEVEEDIVIVGAGIAGLATSLGLHRLGLRSLVLEISESLRASGFAFTTWNNAWKVLDALGVGNSVRHQSHPLASMTTFSSSLGSLSSEVSSKGTGDNELRCLERKFLLETLANELPNDTIRFSSKVVSIEESGPNFKLIHLADGSTIKTKVLIGCDGVNSVVARWLGLKKPLYTGRYAVRGFVEYKQSHGFEPKMMQFMGDGVRYGIVPINNTSLYWFFTYTPSSSQEHQEIEESPIKMKQYVVRNLGKVSDEIKQVIEDTKMEDITCSQLRIRPPWEALWGKVVKGNVCVAGDAFHPMTPDLGQGACSSLEDGISLARCLGHVFLEGDELDDESERIRIGLERYAKERRWRAFDLTATGYVLGLIEESNWVIIKFLRDRVLSLYLAGLRYKKGGFDCGKLA